MKHVRFVRHFNAQSGAAYNGSDVAAFPDREADALVAKGVAHHVAELEPAPQVQELEQPGLPSAEDLDAVADEAEVAEETASEEEAPTQSRRRRRSS